MSWLLPLALLAAAAVIAVQIPPTSFPENFARRLE
jgi:hypothetical protein